MIDEIKGFLNRRKFILRLLCWFFFWGHWPRLQINFDGKNPNTADDVYEVRCRICEKFFAEIGPYRTTAPIRTEEKAKEFIDSNPRWHLDF